MRKRTVKNIANNIFWYFIYALPIIVFIFALFASVYNVKGVDRADPAYFVCFAVDAVNTDFLQIFNGIDPFSEAFGNIFMMLYGEGMTDFHIFVVYTLGWFVLAHIMHILVDAILFIPRLAHKWMEKCTVEE